MVRDMDSVSIHLPDYDSLHLALRRYIVQQGMYQDPRSYARFARQHVLFNGLDDSDSLHRTFRDASGIGIPDYIRLSTALLWAFAERRRTSISTEWFSLLPPPLSGLVDPFLSDLAMTADEAQAWLRAVEADPSVHHEYYGDSPLKHHPLLNDAQSYLPYSVRLLEEALANRVYDVVRQADPPLFMHRFGPLFERYVERGLAYAGLNYACEREMPARHGDKTVDFIAVSGDCNLFIDAKGVELPMAALLSHRADIVRGRMKASAIKAVRQGLDTASRLLDAGRLGGLQLGTGQSFLLVVTFRDFCMSSGRDLLRSIGQAQVDRLMAEAGTPPPIPLGNMYFVPIDDFDSLMSMTKDGHDLARTMARIAEHDSQPDTRKMLFRMHLGPQPAPAFLVDAFESLGLDLETKLIQAEAA